MRNLRSERLIMHQQQVQFIHIMNQELFEAVREQVAGFPVAPVPDLRSSPVSTERGGKGGRKYFGHGDLALEASSDSVIDTLGLAP